MKKYLEWCVNEMLLIKVGGVAKAVFRGHADGHAKKHTRKERQQIDQT